jgi:serine/threonine protein phosphatase PrpC
MLMHSLGALSRLPCWDQAGLPASAAQHGRATYPAEHARGDDANSGSCATVALLRGDALVVANVGDSRAVLCREGQPVVLTAQHRVHGRGEAVKEETRRVQEVGLGLC